MRDIFHTAYRILFNLELELEGFSQDLIPSFRIFPDSETTSLFSKYHIISREQKNSFVYLIEVEPDGGAKRRPLIIPELDDAFRFQLKLKRTDFLSQTNILSYDWAGSVALVTNETNHVEGSDLLLTAPIQDYNAANGYNAGCIVKSGPGFFKAIRESNSSDPHGTGEAAYWKSIAAGDGLSQADLKNRSALLKPADLDALIVIEIKASTPLNPSYEIFDGSLKCNEAAFKIKLYKQN